MLGDVTLSLGDYGVIAVIMGAPITLLSLNLRALTRRQEKIEDRVDDVVDNRVHRRDWLRESISTRQKIDASANDITEILARSDSEVGMAAAVSRLAESLKDRHG